MNFLPPMNRSGIERHVSFRWAATLMLCGSFFFLGTSAPAQRLSPLAKGPEWADLEPFQETITRDEFTRLLAKIYAPRDAWKEFIEIRADAAVIKKTVTPPTFFELRFASSDATAKLPPRYWRPASARASKSGNQPLAGLKVAIDPGHLGGKWAKLEERWYQIGDSKPVTEGDMTLKVAKLLAPKLRALGADVSLVRDSSVPESAKRPDDLRGAAKAELSQRAAEAVPADAQPAATPSDQTIQHEAETLFYRVIEIRTRAVLVNIRIQPDVTVCLHFNAEPWGDASNPAFVDRNHLHLIVNGCYNASELNHDDVRFEMLMKLLNRTFDEELAVSKKVADSMAQATGLPPYEYTRDNACQTDAGPYVWSRNLLANRLYRCPVLYVEPYVMNNKQVFDRVQIGDYKGERVIDGSMRKSIYREYADAVAEGLASHYGSGH